MWATKKVNNNTNGLISRACEGKSVDPLRSEVCKTSKHTTRPHTAVALVLAFMFELAYYIECVSRLQGKVQLVLEYCNTISLLCCLVQIQLGFSIRDAFECLFNRRLKCKLQLVNMW